MKKLVLLGSTGSIGTQTLDIIDAFSDEWKVIGLSANSNLDLLEKQARKYEPLYVVIMNERAKKELEDRLSDLKATILVGEEGLEFLAGETDADFVINALVGAVGLKPTIAALKAGRKIGLANKESMVIGGEIINKYFPERDILPIDSEHNAIFQILEGEKSSDVENIILTASGGPFRNYTLESLKKVTVEEALRHPVWNMGNKITIDSATLMNKGLELIEAHWLFNQPYDKIKVVIHPESIIHSMVEFVDGSIKAVLSTADMRLPIQHVLTFPERRQCKVKKLDLYEIAQLNFSKADYNKFTALKLAYQAGRAGGTMPVVLNSANEIAVSAFLKREITFLDITAIIEKVLNMHENIQDPLLEDIYEVDRWARSKTREVIGIANNN
ncbi:MAG: 1-deoxy-D-xylulose-5-phosphate reductoisomerase [Halanaerobiaceae bacterium]|jgi:1-deoxy-D-xylulose-5-phosphate reductoisomerase|nr:1-deoxy-D-xylulose-5-phosphate reductoisomerase [Halanaerobiaceae bacterium]